MAFETWSYFHNPFLKGFFTTFLTGTLLLELSPLLLSTLDGHLTINSYFALLNSFTTVAMRTFHTACNLPVFSYSYKQELSVPCHHILLSNLEKELLKSTQH